MIQQHLESVQSEYPGTVKEIKNSLYVDDLITRDTTVEGVQQLKHHALEIFNCAKFTLHKWLSNVPELESDCTEANDDFDTGPITTKEIQQQDILLDYASAEPRANTVKFAHDQEQLNLKLKTDGILKCNQDEYPIYSPDSNSFAAEIVKQATRQLSLGSKHDYAKV